MCCYKELLMYWFIARRMSYHMIIYSVRSVTQRFNPSLGPRLVQPHKIKESCTTFWGLYQWLKLLTENLKFTPKPQFPKQGRPSFLDSQSKAQNRLQSMQICLLAIVGCCKGYRFWQRSGYVVDTGSGRDTTSEMGRSLEFNTNHDEESAAIVTEFSC